MPLKIIKICLAIFFTLGAIGMMLPNIPMEVVGIFITALLVVLVVSFIAFQIDFRKHPCKYPGYTKADKEELIEKQIKIQKALRSEGVVPSVNDIIKDDKALLESNSGGIDREEIKKEVEKRLKERKINFTPKAFYAILFSFLPIILYMIFRLIVDGIALFSRIKG